MAKKSVSEDRRARAAAIQAAQARRARNTTVAWASIVVVVVVVLALLLAYGIHNSGKKNGAPVASGASAATVAKAVTSVPSSVFDSIGAGTSNSAPEPLTGQPSMTEGGKPRVLYVGAEYCPYCAAERWALAAAMSRFGTLTGVGLTRSSSTDVDPNTATLDFKNAHYTSAYLAFAPFEHEDGRGQPLQTLSPSDTHLWTSVGGSAFPFVDIAGKYKTGPQYDPGILAGLNQKQIAADLTDPKSPVTVAVVGSANLLTVALCDVTGNKPASVCESAGVKAAAAAITAAKSGS